MAFTLTDTNVFAYVRPTHDIVYLSLGDAHFPAIQLQIINEQMKYLGLRSLYAVRASHAACCCVSKDFLILNKNSSSSSNNLLMGFTSQLVCKKFQFERE